MLIGYARVSTTDQNPDLQIDALLKVGVDRRHIFEDRMSGLRADRPKLNEALAYLTEGGVLVVWKLDRLARSLPHLIEMVAGLDQRGIGFRSLTESIDTTTAGGRLTFHIFGALPSSSATSSASGRWPGLRPPLLADGKMRGPRLSHQFPSTVEPSPQQH